MATRVPTFAAFRKATHSLFPVPVPHFTHPLSKGPHKVYNNIRQYEGKLISTLQVIGTFGIENTPDAIHLSNQNLGYLLFFGI